MNKSAVLKGFLAFVLLAASVHISVCASSVKKFFSSNNQSTSQIDQSTNENTENQTPQEQLKAVGKKALTDLSKAFSYENFKEKFIETYGGQTSGQQGKVRADTKLGYKEKNFISRRTAVASPALEKFTGLQFGSDDEMPKIGLVYSGGGYRAMTLTAGYQKGFEEIGLLDGVMYNVGLSGSTWFIGPWTLRQPTGNDKLTVAAYNNSLIQKIRSGHFDFLGAATVAGKSVPIGAHVKEWNYKTFLNDCIWPKVIFGQSIGAVDLWGAALSHVLLADFTAERQQQHLSYQITKVETGNKVPWPIYTAASMHKSGGKPIYNWYEFTPEEVRNLELGLGFQSYAFGRKFTNGSSVGIDLSNGTIVKAPEQSFGFLMGIFGSAFTLNLADMKRIMLAGTDNNQQESKTLKTILGGSWNPKKIWDNVKNDLTNVKEAVFKYVIDEVSLPWVETIAGMRVSPAQVANPFQGMNLGPKEQWLTGRQSLTFIDAGIDYNVPIRPLFRDERKINMIIVGDSSADAAPGDSFKLALADIKRFKGYTYEKDPTKSDKTLWVYRPSDNDVRQAENAKKEIPPLIVYINFQDDASLIVKSENDPVLKKLIDDNDLKNYNYNKALAGYASTFNFSYTEANFKQLSGWAEFIVRAHKDLLKELVEEQVKQEEAEEMGGGFGDFS